MSAADRKLRRMVRSQEGWGAEDFETLFQGFGFQVREGGNHTVYTHPDHADLRATIPRHKPLKPVYARAAVAIIKTLKERAEADEQADQD